MPIMIMAISNNSSVAHWRKHRLLRRIVVAVITIFVEMLMLHLHQDNGFANEEIILSFDPSKITHVYHIGGERPYGRFNNQFVTVLHAIDIALDKQGDTPNTRAVVAVQGWAYHVVEALFFDSTEWLEELDPVLLVHEQRLDALGLKDNVMVNHVDLDTKDTYYYVMENKRKFSSSVIKSRRQAVLGALLNQQGIAKKNLLLYDALKDHIRKREWKYSNSPDQYVVIHSRWLEGECEKRVGGLLPNDECFMTPSYIKVLLGGTIDKPIVLIWDGQKRDVVQNLKNDTDIGPALIVAEDIAPTDVEIPQPMSDMALAIMSDAFIGTRVSTFAAIVAKFRVARGADPATNFVYTIPNNDGEWTKEICEDCLYLCDEEQSNLCGYEAVFT